MSLRSEIEEFTRNVQRVFGQHCTSKLYTLKFHLPGHLVEGVERFGNMPSTDAALFEHFSALTKHSCGSFAGYRRECKRLSRTQRTWRMKRKELKAEYIEGGAELPVPESSSD